MKMQKAWRGLLLAGGAYLAKRWWEKRRVATGMSSTSPGSSDRSTGSSGYASGSSGYASGGGMGSDPASGSPPGI